MSLQRRKREGAADWSALPGELLYRNMCRCFQHKTSQHTQNPLGGQANNLPTSPQANKSLSQSTSSLFSALLSGLEMLHFSQKSSIRLCQACCWNHSFHSQSYWTIHMWSLESCKRTAHLLQLCHGSQESLQRRAVIWQALHSGFSLDPAC